MENLEITVGELSHLGKKTYRIIDVRDEMAYSFGHIPEAVSVPIEKLESWEPEDAALQDMISVPGATRSGLRYSRRELPLPD